MKGNAIPIFALLLFCALFTYVAECKTGTMLRQMDVATNDTNTTSPNSTTNSTESTTSTSDSSDSSDSSSQDRDSIAYIFMHVWVSELLDKTFFSTFLLSFIYSPAFAGFGYLLGSYISCTISHYVGSIILILPDLLLKLLVAVLYFFFGFHSFIYVYAHKDEASFFELGFSRKKKGQGSKNDLKKENEEEAQKLVITQEEEAMAEEEEEIQDNEYNDDEIQNQKETGGGLRRSKHVSMEDQVIEAAENYVQAEVDDLFGDAPGEEGTNPEGQQQSQQRRKKVVEEPSFFAKIFSADFLKKTPIRFLVCLILYIVADFTDSSFKSVEKLSLKNEYWRVLLTCLAVYLVCFILVLVAGFFLKKYIFAAMKQTPDNVKIVKSIACMLLILLSIVQIFR